MNSKFLILLIALLALPAFAANQVLHYEPKVVTLSGTIKFETFPGPPEYSNISEGDEAETYPFLLLDHPIDVFPIAKEDIDGNGINETEKNVRIVQIAVTKGNATWLKLKSKKHICITGTLYHSHTAHHKSRVLIFEDYTKYCSNTDKSYEHPKPPLPQSN